VTAVREITIAAKDDVFDALLMATAHIAKLEGDAAAEAHVAKLDRLRDQVVAVAGRLFEPAFSEKHLYIDWNSWPDQTCHLDATIDSFSQAFFDELRALLVDEYQEWRMQVVVYGVPMSGQTMVGSIAIWPDRLLIDRALYGVMKWRGLDFRCDAKPIWRKSASK
jgi:hypothetical protein